jgi:hypothetical protein
MPALERERRNQTQREYAARNKEKIKAKSLLRNEYMREYRSTHRDTINAHNRAAKLRKMLQKHGVTLDWYEETLAKQGGMCAYPLCLKVQEPKGRRLAIDHDHETGKARGIMCTFHNTRILADADFHKWAYEYIINNK